MTPRPVIIDCDPGQDDAIAVLMALASPALSVLGLTTVGGNAPLPQTTRNALAILELAGRSDLPVRAGCAAPLRRPLHTAVEVHGTTGLDGADLPPPRAIPIPGHAVDWMIAELRSRPAGTVTLCALGPLTNLAVALWQAPDIAARVGRIVLMGGAFQEAGNSSPVAEYNIFVDPEAASIVLGCGAPVTILPLDATHRALLTPDWLDRLDGLGTPVGRAAAGMLRFYERYDMAKYGTTGGPLHDPHVVAWLLAPDLYRGRDCAVAIDCRAGPGLGQMLVDWWGVTGAPPNAHVVAEVEAAGFLDLVLEKLSRFG